MDPQLIQQAHRQSAPQNPVRMVQQLEGLNDIAEPGVEAVIWNRQVPKSVLAALKNLPAHQVENGRFRTTPEAVRQHVLDVFNAWSWPISDAHEWAADDVARLSAQMARLLSTRHLLLRVELVRDDACRKFHCDTLKARLICTYSGKGTEFGVPESGPPEFGANEFGISEFEGSELGGSELSGFEGDAPPLPTSPSPSIPKIDHVPTGAPILLKGKQWPGYYERTLLHRSPPIENGGDPRLVIALNEA